MSSFDLQLSAHLGYSGKEKLILSVINFPLLNKSLNVLCSL